MMEQESTEIKVENDNDIGDENFTNQIKFNQNIRSSHSSVRHSRNRRGSTDSRFTEENLGDNFEETSWCPPSIEKAKQFKAQAIIRGGNAPLDTINVCHSSDLGPGVSLYFQFVKSISICMAFMSLLSIPSIIFAYYGNAIEKTDADAIGFYQFTLGNIGYDTTSNTYLTDSSCANTYTSNTNSSITCIHIFDNIEFTASQVGSILTVSEILQYFVFMATVYYLNYRLKTLQRIMHKEDTSVCDYAVMVRGLPRDSTFEEVLHHFSTLYALNTSDWKFRPPLIGAQPVSNCEHSNRHAHVGKWVAECTLFKRIGRYIDAFQQHQELTTKLFCARALMKMFANDTPLAMGPDPRRHADAEANMLRISMRLDKIAGQVFQAKHLAFNQESEHGKQSEEDVEPDELKDYNNQLDTEVVAAFITFEYVESFARCIEDYSKYSTFPHNIFYPKELRFRGLTRLRVQRAPEPDDILFENLEVSGLNKFARRLRTTTAMFLALLICFFVILQASRYRQQFSSSIPNLAYCSTIIPQQYTASTTNADVSSVTLVRPPDTLISYYDSQCEAVVGGTFYAVYSRSNSIKKPVVSYDISSCTRPSPFGLCPSVNEVSYCPCLSVQASDLCSTYQCTTVGASSKACLNYQTKLLADCYCASELSSLVKDGKGLAALTSYSQASSTPQCKAFYSGYIVVEVLTYSATFLVVIIGKVLEAFVGVLNRAEKHSCLSEAQGSYMKKIFISLYINMALVVLIVFGRVNGLPSAFAQASVLQGIYPDFTAAWYGNVGAYLLLTFIVQIASVPLWSLFQYFISHPFARWLVYPSIRKCTNTSIIIQDDLNAYEVGPIFETSYATAQSLALLFFAMTFATGIPLLIPLACIAFTMFFTVDKFLICRFYQRPPKISEGVIRSAITLLPFAAILRLAIACWMLSARDIFTSNIIQLNTQRLGSDILVSGPISYAQERLLRPNIFPLFILLLLTVAYYPLRFIFRYIIPLKLLISVFRKCFCTQKHETAVSSRRDGITGYELMLLNDELRQEAAPFSEQYYSYVLSQEKAVKFCRPLCRKKESLFEELSKQEQREGWLHVGRGRHVLKCKVWTQTTDLGYTVRRPGEFKKTHEVIADAGCNSFNLASIPVYKKAIIALEQGAKNLQLDAAILVEKVDKQRRRSSRNRLSMTLEDTVSMESFDEGSAFDYDIESTSTIGNKVVSFKRTPSMSGNHFSTLATSDSEGDDVWESSDSEKEQDDADNDDIFKKESAQTDQNTLANCTRRSKPSPHPSSMPFARSKKVAAVRFSL